MFNFRELRDVTEAFVTMTFVLCLGPVLIMSMIVQ